MFIVGTILGIQFMVASAEDKAKVKEAIVPYVVGCIVIFGAFTIWGTAVNIGQDVLFNITEEEQDERQRTERVVFRIHHTCSGRNGGIETRETNGIQELNNFLNYDIDRGYALNHPSCAIYVTCYFDGNEHEGIELSEFRGEGNYYINGGLTIYDKLINAMSQV